jgi:hypothetical protein
MSTLAAAPVVASGRPRPFAREESAALQIMLHRGEPKWGYKFPIVWTSEQV